MAATISVYFDFGGIDGTPGTSQDVDALGPPRLRWKTADDATINTANPVVVPSADINYSFWKHVYLYCDVAPSGSINNIRFYTDGSGYGTGFTLYVGNQMPTKNSGSSAGYEVAGGTIGTTGEELVANHGGITTETDVFTYTSGSPWTIADATAISEAGNVINAIGETTNYFVFQLAIATTGTPGTATAETLTWKYDET